MSTDKQESKETDSFVKHSADVFNIGTIGIFDFYIWTLIPAIGIIFCFIHTEQERIWSWTGATAAESQSLESKIIVSVISTVIGGCVVATLMKAVSTVSFTLMKYQGATFSHFSAVVGGYSSSHLPILFAGRRWFGILLIFVILIVSTVTKQLAVVSMGVRLVSSNDTMTSYTRDYKSCVATEFIGELGKMLPLSTLDAFNSLRNQNATYTNEYYDKSIPEGLRGESTFVRELPFANVSCSIVPKSEKFTNAEPMSRNFTAKDSLEGSISSWYAEIALILNLDLAVQGSSQWVACTIDMGHATASTTCKDTLCHTERISDITAFERAYPNGVFDFMSAMFKMTRPGSGVTRNPLMSWILGANITTYVDIQEKIPGESVQMIQDRLGILGTMVGRILCDYNNKQPYTDTVTFQSNYISSQYYVNRILWKWPFWLLAGFIFAVWIICMIAMRMTPESRIISVEWFISQYIIRNRYGYLSGSDLVKAHQKTLLQVVDASSDENVGNVSVIQTDTYKDIRNQRVRHDKQYQ
ncbi:uncharacterized protein EV154DRAFT_559226 [Mucor mucedo]|uniref:uncharacterized protein n=1 Tax=Mucor mucedo TaxID=29922 RepID=UPI00221E5987|nr:uncharacterized protein EV154DRAFT_559226 [Mucor mucedo]KAI7895461.1 hypothetical protein EV154DRAFT_559226 [Mucor mucedo]